MLETVPRVAGGGKGPRRKPFSFPRQSLTPHPLILLPKGRNQVLDALGVDARIRRLMPRWRKADAREALWEIRRITD